MAESTSGKVCVLCGENCATQPRVKDSHGNYYHKTCHEMAAEKNRQRRLERESRAAKPAEKDPLDLADDEHAARAAGDSGMDDAMRGMRLDDGDGDGLRLDADDSAAPRSKPRPRSEPSPAAEASDEAAYDILKDSGPGKPQATSAAVSNSDDDESFNLLAELADEQAAAAPPAAASSGFGIEPAEAPAAPPTMASMAPASRASAGGGIWHLAVGIISIVLGGGGVLLIVGGWVMAFSSGNFTGIGGIVPLILSAMLLTAGVRITRRDQAGVPLIIKWAWIKATLTVVCGGILLAVAGTASGLVAESAGLSEADVAEAGIGLLMSWLIGWMAWSLAWPVFVLIWFKRTAIESEVARWN